MFQDSHAPSTACSTPAILPHDPYSYKMEELPAAKVERARVNQLLDTSSASLEDFASPLFVHLSHGLAYTVGSALGSIPPSVDTCLKAYMAPNVAGLSAGARAWSKHSHRSIPQSQSEGEEDALKKMREISEGWWGRPFGPVVMINENALLLFWKIMDCATWKNLHWLPHQVLVYEVRVAEGYGMRWSQNQSDADVPVSQRPWVFRGSIEPMMENGHEVGWRHSANNRP